MDDLEDRLRDLARKWDYESELSLSMAWLWRRCADELRAELERR